MSDSENVDPMSKASPTKKHKNHPNQDFCKPTRNIRLVTKPKRLETPAKKPLQTSPFSRPASTSAPNSAPPRASAGRSPRSKAIHPFARRSVGTGTPSRSKPRAFASLQGPRATLSIDSALNKTYNASRPKSKLAPVAGISCKKSWNFEIHVDTEQEEMGNLMEHSTSILDISDHERNDSPKDDRGKENIPPAESLHPTVTAQPSGNSRATDMTDEPREPLGELNLQDFVPEGVNPSEAVLIFEDEPEVGSSTKKARSPLSITETSEVDEPAQHSEQPQLLNHQTISSIINNSSPLTKDSSSDSTSSAPTDFEIWESDSSTEEATSTDC